MATDMNISFKEAREALKQHNPLRLDEITMGVGITNRGLQLTQAGLDNSSQQSFPVLSTCNGSNNSRGRLWQSQATPGSQRQGNIGSTTTGISRTQDLIWLTQQQNVNRKSREGRAVPRYETELDLPPFTDPQQAAPIEDLSSCCGEISIVRTHNRSNINKSNINANDSNKYDIKQLIIKLLPMLIKLCLASQPTDKLACIVEIGEMLEVQSLVSSIIAGIGSTSITSSSS